MRQQIEAFLKDLEKKGLSENTVAAYRNDLFQLMDFVDKGAKRKGAAAPQWPSISQEFLMRYAQNELGGAKNYAPATIARKVSAIKSLFEFLAATGVVQKTPNAELKSPRIRRQPPQPITAEQVKKLLEQPVKSGAHEVERDGAMLEFLYHTGMRVSEIVSLNLGDVDLEVGYVRCRGRHSRERNIAIPPETIQALRVYFGQGRPHLARNKEEQALFLNRLGQRLTRQGFWQILKGYTQAANLGVKVTPRTLRHSLAAHMVGEGTALALVQQRLGHANISTTRIYAHFAQDA